jgi:type II restriction/modification system DNA methylase subunit YeeA
MNTAKIKAYAPQARRDFIQAVTERANRYGIYDQDSIEPMEIKGDVAIIGEQAFPKSEGEMRERLVQRIKAQGFEAAIRAVAYTWFNQFAALRYMELHQYLDHGFRVLSHPDGLETPEILEHAAEVDLPGLDREKAVELRLAGDKDNELYRLLILAQCSALHNAMPFLFNEIDSETALLMPDHLLHSNSPLRKMVTDIDEEEWQDVEIIGWLYQYYISERKDQVIGKVVQSEDIPAATQLFTPNWIVKYMVQNTLGRMWLATYPDSPLRDKMEYYIEPAEQDPEVQRQVEEITPQELNPEQITFLDPACGSGHILVEAYALFKEIYLERGYRTRDIPELILEKNLYGLDIDDRATQMAGFAVLMKAREDDRRVLGRGKLNLNVMAIQASSQVDTRNIELFFKGDENTGLRPDLNKLVRLFADGKTLGSLITVPSPLVERMADIENRVYNRIGGWHSGSDVHNIIAMLRQAKILSKQFDCVVSNPPYMGSKFFNPMLKSFINKKYNNGKGDFYASFIIRNIYFCRESGFVGMITIPNWMFLSTFENLRNILFNAAFIDSFIHIGRGVWGSDFGSCSFIIRNYHSERYKGTYKRLFEKQGSVAHNDELENRFFKNSKCYASVSDFTKIPGSPIAYWVSKRLGNIYTHSKKLIEIADSIQGMITGDNNKFLRRWHEINHLKLSLNKISIDKVDIINSFWIPYNKGGDLRKWYGNNDFVLNWRNEGKDLTRSRTKNAKFYFKPCITWTFISSSFFAARKCESGFVWDVAGSSAFPHNIDQTGIILCFMCSKVGKMILDAINPTLNYQVENILALPIHNNLHIYKNEIKQMVDVFVLTGRADWDAYETSWDFTLLPLLTPNYIMPTLKKTYAKIRDHWRTTTMKMQRLEEENNRIFIEAYGLQEELTPDVPLSEITLTCNPHYRYGGNKTEVELESQLQTDTIKELISYAIGCMMGRYSIDASGLVYANASNIGFNHDKYTTFQADDDGIIPIMDQEWFKDDATNRFVEFIKVAWPAEHIEENLTFISQNLNPKAREEAQDTIRRYMSTSFFKDHLKTYKKRPIYWLFSSGKQKAFECLVYLHRYNGATLSRMRSLYVTPLQGNFMARLDFLKEELDAADTASAQKKIQKEIDVLKKKQAELSVFDDELRHYADMRIELDLDDGVKVNYGKFGKLLAETKSITGKK